MESCKAFLIIQCLVVSSLAIDLRHPTFRIIDGDEADIKDFPYMGAFLVNGIQFCGASLITYDAVVTAAHCINRRRQNITQLSLRFGSSKWRTGGQQIFVKELIFHESYVPDGMDYDIAVVKLCKRVTIKNAIPISLSPAGYQYPDGTLGVASGWGYTSFGKPSSASEILRKVELPVFNESECRKIYGNIITNRTICAGYKDGGKDVCSQDSGGPYVINGDLAGIVSFGYKKCGLHPSAYASISTFSDWIKQKVKI